MAGGAQRLEVRGLTKTFPGVTALADVSLSVAPGEVRALLGENGAGKSTLGKIVAGIHAATEGMVLLDGEAVAIADERAAGRLGIGIVHQEGSLVPQLTVAENIFAGRQPTGFLGQVDVPVVAAFALADMQRSAVRVEIGDLEPGKLLIAGAGEQGSLDQDPKFRVRGVDQALRLGDRQVTDAGHVDVLKRCYAAPGRPIAGDLVVLDGKVAYHRQPMLLDYRINGPVIQKLGCIFGLPKCQGGSGCRL